MNSVSWPIVICVPTRDLLPDEKRFFCSVVINSGCHYNDNALLNSNLFTPILPEIWRSGWRPQRNITRTQRRIINLNPMYWRTEWAFPVEIRRNSHSRKHPNLKGKPQNWKTLRGTQKEKGGRKIPQKEKDVRTGCVRNGDDNSLSHEITIKAWGFPRRRQIGSWTKQARGGSIPGDIG